MKVTPREVIQSGERDLMDAITADLDWGVVEQVFRKKHHLDIDDNVVYRRGDIVVHQGQVAYQLDFEVKIALSILVDRQGGFLTTHTSAPVQEEALSAPAHGDEVPPEAVDDTEKTQASQPPAEEREASTTRALPEQSDDASRLD